MVQPIPPEELSSPVQCETDPTAGNRVVVYDDLSYTPTSVSSVDSSTGLEGALGEIHHQEENPVYPYRRYLVSRERWSTRLNQHQHPNIANGNEENLFRQGQNTPRVKTLVNVILLLLIVFFLLIFNIFNKS